ncbi:MAG: WD40 repeat domain-containing protein, partial [Microcystaceae cyanobacterium]
IWNRQGQLLRYFRADSRNLLGITWSPDGQQLLTGGSDKMLSLWTAQGRRLKTWHAHQDLINSVAWSHTVNGVSVIASGSRDRTVKLWTTEVQLLRTLTGHQQSVNVVTFSPDGQWLASGSDDTTVRLWRRSGQAVRTIPTGNSSILTVAFSPNNQTLLAAGAG